MAIDFPASPSVNQEVTQGNMVWFWNGTYWEIRSSTSKFTAGDSPPSSYTAGDFWYESDTGKLFIRYDNTWVEVGHSSDAQTFKVQDTIPTGIANDIWYESDTGKTFIYYDSVWVEIGFATSGQTFNVGDAAPSSATAGDIWFESDSGGAYIYYNDGDSSQWVEMGHSVSGINVNIDGGVSGTNYGGLTALDGGAS